MILGICGHGRHGKGTAAAYIALKTGMRYKQSTSEAAAEMMFSKLQDKYGYKTVKEAWDDRVNHRQEWAETIWAYNQPDGLTLYQGMLPDNDILEGVRQRDELQALRDHGIIDLVVWVDGSKRNPVESTASCQVSADDADLVIDNNGTLDELKERLDRFIAEHLVPE